MHVKVYIICIRIEIQRNDIKSNQDKHLVCWQPRDTVDVLSQHHQCIVYIDWQLAFSANDSLETTDSISTEFLYDATSAIFKL